MEIETYEIEELNMDSSPAEVESEALKLIEQLDLEGQKTLVVPVNDAEDDQRRIPYPQMTAQEVRVYSTLYPVHEPVSQYKAGIFPVRILQVIGHAKGLFQGIEVWHDRVMNPDPVLVGKGEGFNVFYLLARWGEALAPFDDLVSGAIEKLRKEWRQKAERKKRECEAFLVGLDLYVEKHIAATEYVSTPF